jgi:chromate transporter
MVLAILVAGVAEVTFSRRTRPTTQTLGVTLPSAMVHVGTVGGVGALVWVALKVGALSYGGGFVIVPLMQHDVVTTYHWMSGAHFLNAVVLGQVTPGPVVLTVAAVGYAAKGLLGGLLGALVAFAPSFLFVLLGAPRFDRLRASETATNFLAGAGPCVIGAIAGSALPLSLLLHRVWQAPIALAAVVWLFAVRRSPLSALLLSGAAGAIIVLAQSHA